MEEQKEHLISKFFEREENIKGLYLKNEQEINTNFFLKEFIYKIQQNNFRLKMKKNIKIINEIKNIEKRDKECQFSLPKTVDKSVMIQSSNIKESEDHVMKLKIKIIENQKNYEADKQKNLEEQIKLEKMIKTQRHTINDIRKVLANYKRLID